LLVEHQDHFEGVTFSVDGAREATCASASRRGTALRRGSSMYWKASVSPTWRGGCRTTVRRPAAAGGAGPPACSLVQEPRVLLLDEPLSSLDAGLRGNMRTMIRALSKRSWR
jgi:hypothetical protein